MYVHVELNPYNLYIPACSSDGFTRSKPPLHSNPAKTTPTCSLPAIPGASLSDGGEGGGGVMGGGREGVKRVRGANAKKRPSSDGTRKEKKKIAANSSPSSVVSVACV